MIKTKTIRYRNGHKEILRILSTSDLADWKGGDPYVRVVEVRCAKSRRGPLLLQGKERVIGYSKLMADAPRDPQTSRFTRRLFYLKEEDKSDSCPPAGRAVDPRTILPGVAGKVIQPHSAA